MKTQNLHFIYPEEGHYAFSRAVFPIVSRSPKLSKIKQFKSLLFGASEDDKKKVLKVEDSFL